MLFTPVLLAAFVVPDARLAPQAQAVLRTHCYRCHGQDGAVEGGVNYILDPAKLVARKKVRPGDADGSPIYRRTAEGQMPPPGSGSTPTSAELAILKAWINRGAHAGPPTARPWQSNADLHTALLRDLEQLDRRARRFQRYLSLAHLANAGATADELQTYRHALNKLLNSLSWHPRIQNPVAVDPQGLLLRFDLRWYQWDATQWNRLLTEYPYGVLEDTPITRALANATATRLPIVRGDWFLATASRPPIYQELLQLPTSLSDLERQLRVDAEANIRQERVARVGFNGSGVSRNNRLLERHDSAHGAYWRTYDFDAIPQNLVDRGNLPPDRRNLFAFPLGPGAAENQFQHAGGEAIFELPNHLHGYMLANAQGVRIDKGPINVVSDPKRPDRAVETGISCLSCHAQGIIPKTDQVRLHLDRNPTSFSRADAELIRALYPPAAYTTALMDADRARFAVALTQTGVKPNTAEPIGPLVVRYEADLDLPTAAAEAGLPAPTFADRIRASEALARHLGALRVPGGTVSRIAFLQAFGDIVRELTPGTLFQPGVFAASADNTGELDPLEALTAPAQRGVASADGAWFALASTDRTVRIWDVRGERETRRLIGHSASIWALALNADGTRAVSAGTDGSVRLWDASSGQELRRFDGHLTLVGAVALSSDGTQIVSAGHDGAVIVWDAATGRELHRYAGLADLPHAAHFLPDGRHVVLADQRLRIIDSTTGQVSRAFAGPVSAVSVVGPWLAAVDGTNVRIWDTRTQAPATTIATVASAVALTPDGRWLATGGTEGSVRLWSVRDGSELGVFRKHTAPVVALGFRTGATHTVSVSRDAAVFAWDIGRFGTPANAAGSTASVSWKPTVARAVDAHLSQLALTENRKWLIGLDAGTGRLARWLPTKAESAEWLTLAPGTHALALNGAFAYTVAPRRAGKGTLQVIDTVGWKIAHTHSIDADPYDLAVGANGDAYLSGGSGGWNTIAVVDSLTGKLRANWGGIWEKSLLHFAPGSGRLYLGSQGVQPSTLEALAIPASVSDQPLRYSGSASSGAGGLGTLSPDGRFFVSATGSVVRLSANRDDDLRLAATVPAHLAAAIDAPAGVAYLSVADGTLRRYAYPAWTPSGTLALPGIAYRLSLDGPRRQLHAAIFDATTLAGRTRGGSSVQTFALEP